MPSLITVGELKKLLNRVDDSNYVAIMAEDGHHPSNKDLVNYKWLPDYSIRFNDMYGFADLTVYVKNGGVEFIC